MEKKECTTCLSEQSSWEELCVFGSGLPVSTRWGWNFKGNRPLRLEDPAGAGMSS